VGAVGGEGGGGEGEAPQTSQTSGGTRASFLCSQQLMHALGSALTPTGCPSGIRVPWVKLAVHFVESQHVVAAMRTAWSHEQQSMVTVMLATFFLPGWHDDV
jgi:hypothetical protein